MNLTDFTIALNHCGSSVDITWKEEDKKSINPLNNMVSRPLFIGEEVKKCIPTVSPSSVVICMHPTITYNKYGKVSSFVSSGYILPNPTPVGPKPFTPDIVVNTRSTISFIEIKKITNQTPIRGTKVKTYPTIFAPSGTNVPLVSNTYGNSGSAIFSSPSNGNLMTFFHEGQIFHDVARLLNFRQSNEKLFFGAFIFSPTDLAITQTDIENRLDTTLNSFNSFGERAEVFSEGYGFLNSWPVPSLSSSNFTKATTNGFQNGAISYGSKTSHEIFAIAFEIKN